MDNDILKVKEALGLTTEGLDALKKRREERAAKIKTNANEVMHTTNTGYGAELVPTNVLQANIFDAIPTYATFLNALPGFHGYDMAISEKVAVKGDLGFFQGNTEPTTGALLTGQGTNRLATGEVTITQAPLVLSVDVSKRELNYSIEDLESIITQKIAASAARTAESMIINGDVETGGTGNVNSDDQAPATTFATEGGASYHALLIDHGIRELAINNSLTVNAGTIDMTDLTSVENLLGDYFADAGNCLWLFNRKTYNKLKGLQAFYDASQRGMASTLSGNAITNIDGADLFIARDLRLAEADGKQSATPGSNTLGTFGLIWKPAIQYGYGQRFELDVVKVPGKGIQIIATFEFGFGIVQKQAGVTDSVLGLAINATVA